MTESISTVIVSHEEAHRTAWRQYWRKVTEFDHGRMEVWVALRNAIGVTLPLAVGVALRMPLGGLAMSTGALQVSYSDGHSPYAQRAKRMLAASLLCAVAVVAGGLAGRNAVLAVIVPALWAFAAGLAVSIGPTADSLGVISLVTLVIYSAQTLTPQRAFLSGLLALGGGLLQTALALSLWPVSRYQPERHALSSLYIELSHTAVVPAVPGAGPPASDQSSLARETLAGLGNDNSLVAERYWSLLNQAERIRLSLLALRRLRKRMQRDALASSRLEFVQQFLDLAGDVLATIGASLSIGESADSAPESMRGLETLAENLRQEEASPTTAFLSAMTKDARLQMDALVGQLRSVVRTVSETTPAGFEAQSSRDAIHPWPRRITGSLAKLRANFTLQSSAFRHAIRLSVPGYRRSGGSPDAQPSLLLAGDDDRPGAEAGVCSNLQPRAAAHRRHDSGITAGNSALSLFPAGHWDGCRSGRRIRVSVALGWGCKLWRVHNCSQRAHRCDGCIHWGVS